MAGIFELGGAWFVGNKSRWGFVFNFVGCCLCIWVAFHTKVYGLLVIVVPALGVNVRNFVKWSVQGRPSGTLAVAEPLSTGTVAPTRPS